MWCFNGGMLKRPSTLRSPGAGWGVGTAGSEPIGQSPRKEEGLGQGGLGRTSCLPLHPPLPLSSGSLPPLRHPQREHTPVCPSAPRWVGPLQSSLCTPTTTCFPVFFLRPQRQSSATWSDSSPPMPPGTLQLRPVLHSCTPHPHLFPHPLSHPMSLPCRSRTPPPPCSHRVLSCTS
jgi:hypothetical protein